MKKLKDLGIDISKEYGVVLEGGGAKGAYQIGVWKALKEYGVKIRGVAGVSVGALNGALICMDDIEQAEQIWQNISYSQIMQVEDQEVEALINMELKNINLPAVTKNSLKFITDRGIDITPLRELIEKYVDEDKIKKSDIQLLLGTLSLSDMKGLEIDAKDLSEGELKDYLVASASLPGFKREKFQGKSYLDGGMVNNVPVDMLVNRGYKDIIVIRIFGIGVERKVKLPDGVKVVEISPRVDLGNILDFSKDRARRNMKIGYYDAMRVIDDLQGKIYYIKESLEEEEYAKKFLEMNSAVKMAWLEYLKEDYSQEEIYSRKFFEVVLPSIAEKLGIGKHWSYRELYLSMLELTAKKLRVIKYRVYSLESFTEEIKMNYERYVKEEKKKDWFVELIIKAVVIGNEQ